MSSPTGRPRSRRSCARAVWRARASRAGPTGSRPPCPPGYGVAAMDRVVALIVNPNAGGGRAADALPVVEATLTRLGLRFHTERTTSVEHGEDLARAAVAAGEAVAGLSGDGLI